LSRAGAVSVGKTERIFAFFTVSRFGVFPTSIRTAAAAQAQLQ
jgi:hypothetical protein